MEKIKETKKEKIEKIEYSYKFKTNTDKSGGKKIYKIKINDNKIFEVSKFSEQKSPDETVDSILKEKGYIVNENVNYIYKDNFNFK